MFNKIKEYSKYAVLVLYLLFILGFAIFVLIYRPLDGFRNELVAAILVACVIFLSIYLPYIIKKQKRLDDEE